MKVFFHVYVLITGLKLLKSIKMDVFCVLFETDETRRKLKLKFSGIFGLKC